MGSTIILYITKIMASGFTGFFGQTYQDMSTNNDTNNNNKPAYTETNDKNLT